MQTLRQKGLLIASVAVSCHFFIRDFHAKKVDDPDDPDFQLAIEPQHAAATSCLNLQLHPVGAGPFHKLPKKSWERM